MAIAAITLGVKGSKYRELHPEAHGKAHSVVAIIGGCIGLLVNIIAIGAIIVGMTL